MSKKHTLQQLFSAEWADDAPATLVQLMSAEYDDLDDTARALRALAVELVHSFEREPVLTAESAMRLLEKHHLPSRPGKWVCAALNKELERVYTKSNGGGMRLIHTVTRSFPTTVKVSNDAPLPEGGAYILIYGGGPEILEDESIRADFEDLKSRHRVVDLVLWDESDNQATFWSVRAGKGQSGSMTHDFPKPDLAERWWNG